ncbi:DDE-type integrase/transposase/recombinase, partial [Flavobacteriaceae bacterium]|nr:DDE-type integrase/transposase/recombinase [Flavobacteriaceae bacterium]
EDIKEGCSIIEKQAELLKIKFGSAWPGENKENEIVSIPGLRGRDPKEITLKNLSKIIHARVVEIIEQVYVEIKNYGHEEQKKKLIAGIVLTGGGSQLKHLKQLVEYITGMDTRVGYPNEHLAGDSDSDITSPMYATAVGLVMDSLMRQEKRITEIPKVQEEDEDETPPIPIEAPRDNRSFLDKLTERVKDFLLTKRRQRISAQKFLIKAIENNVNPELINIDKSGSNKAAIKLYNRRNYSNIKIRQCKYLNNIVEQDHRMIKWRIMLGLGFKEFESAKRTISGIEVVRMIKKNQLVNPESSTYKSFISLAS